LRIEEPPIFQIGEFSVYPGRVALMVINLRHSFMPNCLHCQSAITSEITSSTIFRVRDSWLTYVVFCKKCQKTTAVKVPESTTFRWADAPNWWNKKGELCNRVDPTHQHAYLDYWRNGIPVTQLKAVVLSK